MDQAVRSGVPDLPRGRRGKRVAARHRPVTLGLDLSFSAHRHVELAFTHSGFPRAHDRLPYAHFGPVIAELLTAIQTRHVGAVKGRAFG